MNSILVESAPLVKDGEARAKHLPVMPAHIKMSNGIIHDDPPPPADNSAGPDHSLSRRESRLDSGHCREQLYGPALSRSLGGTARHPARTRPFTHRANGFERRVSVSQRSPRFGLSDRGNGGKDIGDGLRPEESQRTLG